MGKRRKNTKNGTSAPGTKTNNRKGSGSRSRRRGRGGAEEPDSAEALTGERLKLVIRKLPPNLTEEECAKALRAAFPDNTPSAEADEASAVADDDGGAAVGDDGAESASVDEKASSAPFIHGSVVWFSYKRGKTGTHRVVPSRAYIAVTSTADVAAIHKAMDGRLFVSDKGTLTSVGMRKSGVYCIPISEETAAAMESIPTLSLSPSERRRAARGRGHQRQDMLPQDFAVTIVPSAAHAGCRRAPR